MKKENLMFICLIILIALFAFAGMSSGNRNSDQDREATGYLKSIANSLDGIESELEKLNSRSLSSISSELDDHGRSLSKIADELRSLRDVMR